MNATLHRAAETSLSPTVECETELICRLQLGEAAAFESLVRIHGPRLLAVAHRLLRNEEDARDAFQDGLISAFKCIGQFNGQAQLGTWLHRIVVNAALMKLRTRKRRNDCSIDDLLPTFFDDGHRRNVRPAWQASADEILERRDLRDVIRKKINELPEDYRTVLMLRDIEELDTDETAAVLGINPGAIKTRLHRARMALRELLETELSRCSV